jgi:hypothetical protein
MGIPTSAVVQWKSSRNDLPWNTPAAILFFGTLHGVGVLSLANAFGSHTTPSPFFHVDHLSLALRRDLARFGLEVDSQNPARK